MNGVTANPTLLAREGGDWRAQARTIGADLTTIPFLSLSNVWHPTERRPFSGIVRDMQAIPVNRTALTIIPVNEGERRGVTVN